MSKVTNADIVAAIVRLMQPYTKSGVCVYPDGAEGLVAHVNEELGTELKKNGLSSIMSAQRRVIDEENAKMAEKVRGSEFYKIEANRLKLEERLKQKIAEQDAEKLPELKRGRSGGNGKVSFADEAAADILAEFNIDSE